MDNVVPVGGPDRHRGRGPRGRNAARPAGPSSRSARTAHVIGPALGHLAARWPYRRSIPALAVLGATVTTWTVVLAWPGRAPLPRLVLLVVVLASNGPGSLMSSDYARTENEAASIGSATGIVNLGGFVASLLTIGLIGIVLSVTSGSGPGSYTLEDFKLAFCVQYGFWTVGLAGVLLSRRRLRRVRGIHLDPFPYAVVRVWRQHSAGAGAR